MAADKTVLITGCSEGGIGFALAKEFQSRGLRVFATARSPSKMAALEGLPGVTLLPLNVTSAESISATVDAVSAETGGKLDYLVNNSGVAYLMPLIDADIQYAKDMYDVNVWGAVAMSKAFAPLIIAAQGSIVNLSSIGTLVSQPYMGLYAGSKAALEAISESMRLELKPFGVKVVTVITGATQTNTFVNTPPNLPDNSVYAPAEKEISDRQQGRGVEGRLGKPQDLARELVGDILRGATGKVFRGKYSTFTRLLSTYFPSSMQVSERPHLGLRGMADLTKPPGAAANYKTLQDTIALANSGLNRVGN